MTTDIPITCASNRPNPKEKKKGKNKGSTSTIILLDARKATISTKKKRGKGF